MSRFPSHGGSVGAPRGILALPGKVLHKVNDTLGYGNLHGMLDLIIVQSVTFLGMSLLGLAVLYFSGAPFNEETKRTACLMLPAFVAPIPGIILNNLHRFRIWMDLLLLTGDILNNNPAMSVPRAYWLSRRLMKRIKETVGYNRRPACRYMRSDYPYLLTKVVQRVHESTIPIRTGRDVVV